MGARATVRAVAAGVALMLLGAAAGWVPLFPAVAIAILVTLVVAGESLIAVLSRAASHPLAPKAQPREALIDTSALIDGRLPDVVLSGFCDLDLIVPEFVLRELQHVADAPDPMRRARGRRGSLRTTSPKRARSISSSLRWRCAEVRL